MKKCISCGAQLPEEAAFCPHCATVQKEKFTPSIPFSSRRNPLKIAGLLLVLLLVMGGTAVAVRVFSRTPESIPEVITYSELPEVISEIEEAPSPSPVEEETTPISDETIYKDEDGIYHLFLSSSTSALTTHYAEGERSISIPVGIVTNTPSILGIYKDYTDDDVRNEFMLKVRSISVEAIALNGGTSMQASAPRWGNDFPESTQVSDVTMEAGVSDSTEILWSIEMLSGELLQLHQIIHVELSDSLVLTPRNVDMSTSEALQKLLTSLQYDISPGTTVELYLPAVIYESPVSISAFGVHLYGCTENGITTTFAANVDVSATESQPTIISGITFAGTGDTGLSCTAGVVLESCTFTGWDVTAMANQGGWVAAHYCTFENNGVGIALDTMEFSYSDTGYVNNLFRGNSTAMEIRMVPSDLSFTFEDSTFIGNNTNVTNSSAATVSLDSALILDS